MTGTLLFVWMMTSSLLLPIGAPVEGYERWLQSCKDGEHVTCTRDGVVLLSKKLTTKQKRQVLSRLAGAYLALGQQERAEREMNRAVQIAPCQLPPQGLPAAGLALYKRTQQGIFQKDAAAPILSHISPPVERFKQNGLLTAKATDDLKVRSVSLYYRTTPKAPFLGLALERKPNDRFSIKVPAKVRRDMKIFDYYISAQDCLNRSTSVGSADQPLKLITESKGSPPKTIGGTVMIAVGVAMLLATPLAFIQSNEALNRWRATNDLAASEEIREQIILYQALGWGGLGLGLALVGGGTAMVLPDSFWKSLSPPKRPTPLSPQSRILLKTRFATPILTRHIRLSSPGDQSR